LKAYLQEACVSVPRTHNLVQLLDLLLPMEPGLRSLRRGCKSLSRFAVEYRYPGAGATARQTEAALRWANRIRSSIRLRLGLTL
jgi:HEPN domain-containing protein